MKRKLTVILFIIILMLAVCPSGVYATDIAGGECGENAVWTLSADGTFTVSGKGAMTDWENDYGVPDRLTYPWKEHISQIKRVVVEEGITHIGNSSFFAFKELESAYIPSSAETIGEYAFGHCFKLREVKIDGILKEIGAKAFYACYELSWPHMADEMPGLLIGMQAFYNTGIEKIVIPKGTRYIQKQAFSTTKAKELIWEYPIDGDNIISSNDRVFEYNNNLTKVVIPDGQTKIFPEAFLGCENLGEVWIPYSVYSDPNSFRNCNNLKNVYYGGSENDWWFEMNHGVYSASDNAEMHFNCNNNRYIFRILHEENNLWWEVTTDGTVSFEGNGVMPTVSYQGNKYLSDKTSVRNAVIKDGLTSISARALSGYSSLENIEIPDSVNFIDYEAFRDCKSLLTVSLPDSITDIGKEAFMDCEKLVTIEIPARVQLLRTGIFSGCNNLESIVIPKRVSTIQENVFSSLSLTDIYYKGTEEEWNEIIIGAQPESFNNVTVHFNFKGNIVSFFENGGTDGPETLISQDEKTVTIPEKVPANGTIRFLGWSTSANARKADYQPGDTAEIDGHTVFAAVWLNPEDCADHEWGEKNVYWPSTCGNSGMYSRYCIHCGELDNGYEPALGHDMGEWTDKIPATETVNGIQSRKCSRCSYEEERTVITVLTGDVNGDKKINALDATQILRYSNTKPSVFSSMTKDEIIAVGDVNNDGKVNALDATQILRYANGKPSTLKKAE